MPDVDDRILMLSVARAFDTTAIGVFVVLLPAYLGSGAISFPGRELAGVPEQFWAGVAVGAGALASAVFQHATGRLSDRVGQRRPFVLIGVALVGVAGLLYPLATRFTVVTALHAAQGFGAALALPASLAAVESYCGVDGRGEAVGLFNTVRLLGYVAGPGLGGLVLADGPYRLSSEVTVPPVVVGSVVAAIAAAASIVVVTTAVPEPTTPVVSAEPRSEPEPSRGIGQPVTSLGVAVFLLSGTVDVIVPLQAAVNARLGQSTTAFGLQYGALILTVVVLLVPFGRLSDRYGRRPLIVAGAGLLGPLVAVQAVIHSPLVMLLARVGQGVALALAFSPSLAFAADAAGPGETARNMAVVTVAYGLARAAGPVVGGALVAVSYETPFLVAGFAATVGFLIAVAAVRRPRPRRVCATSLADD